MTKLLVEQKNLILFFLFLVAPIVSVPKHIIQVEINQDLSIDCHIKAFPHPKRVWIRKSIELIKSNGKYNIELKESLFSSNFRLTIKSIQKQDLGSYLCFASNNLGAQQALVIIKGELIVFQKLSTQNQFCMLFLSIYKDP